MADTYPILVAPSILAADYGRFADDALDAITHGGDWVHCDVMDGHFVDNISFGAEVVAAVGRKVCAPLDVHLMITRPDHYFPRYVNAGAASISVHVEAEHDVGKTLAAIREAGCRAGLALNPPTPLEAVFPFLDRIDLLLLMTVNPGFGGQAFMPEIVPKIAAAARYREAHRLHFDIEVDGGIKPSTAGPCITAGANVLVAGTSVFAAPDRAAAIRQMREER